MNLVLPDFFNKFGAKFKVIGGYQAEFYPLILTVYGTLTGISVKMSVIATADFFFPQNIENFFAFFLCVDRRIMEKNYHFTAELSALCN